MSTLQTESNEEVNTVSRKSHRELQKEEKKIDRQLKKKEKQEKKEQRNKQLAEKRQNKRPVRRVFPIWLRIIVVLVLSCVALIAGLMVGYGVLGGGAPTDALKFETWQHIIELVTGNV